MAWQLWMYNKQPFRKSTTLSCSVSWLVGEIVIVLFWGFLPILGLFWETDWLFQQDVQAWISLCALLYFSSFWPWKLMALNVTGQCHHRQLPRPMRAKPHLPDARFMPIRTASICVYACVYIDIYIKREKYLWIYFFSYFVMRAINKKQMEKTSLFLVEHCHVILKGSVYFLGSRLWILVVY